MTSILFINYYTDKNPSRQAELNYCVLENIKSFDHVLVIANKRDFEAIKKLTGGDKLISPWITDRRPTYSDYFQLTRRYKTSLNVIANLDIVIPKETLDKASAILENNKNTCLALTRWDMTEGLSVEFYDRTDSQDSWFFCGEVKEMPAITFGLGVAGCDNSIAYKLEQAGYNVINPSLSLKTYHNHITGIRNYLDDKGHTSYTVPPPYKTLVPTTINVEVKKSSPETTPVPARTGKKRLLHVMLGNHNPNMQKGLESVFECRHIDWTDGFKEPTTAVKEEVQHIAAAVHGFDVRNPSGEIRPPQHAVAPVEILSTEFDVKLLKVFYEFRPDIVFLHVQREGVVSLDSIKAMRKTAKIINWTGDVRWPIPSHYKTLGKEMDMTLFTNMEDVLELQRLLIPSDFLQVGFDSEQFNPEGPKNDNYPEIIFMGANYGRQFPISEFREVMVKTLRAEFGNKFGVYGGNWADLSNGIIDNYAEEGKAYRSCKIAISLSHFDRTKYASDRLFRILGAGPMCLSHKYKGIEEDFTIGEDLDVFHTMQDLVDKIKFYLANEEARKKIAETGCKKAHDKFTWHHFAKNLDEISSRIDKKLDVNQ